MVQTSGFPDIQETDTGSQPSYRLLLMRFIMSKTVMSLRSARMVPEHGQQLQNQFQEGLYTFT